MKTIFIILLLVSINAYGQKDTVKVIMLVSDKLSRQTSLKFGYQVREVVNTIEKDSSTVLCCSDYWQPVMYLDEGKNCFPANIVVWQFLYIEWEIKKQEQIIFLYFWP